MNQSRNKIQGSALFTLISGVVIAVATLALLVKLATSGYYSDVAQTTESATETRIMPSGRLVLGDGVEAGQRTGQQVFDKICSQCHAADSTVAFSPKVTHNDQWTARIAQGFETLVQHAVQGFKGPAGGVMPAKGGATDLTDEEVARAVAYMANQSGANFPESVGSNSVVSAVERKHHLLVLLQWRIIAQKVKKCLRKLVLPVMVQTLLCLLYRTLQTKKNGLRVLNKERQFCLNTQ